MTTTADGGDDDSSRRKTSPKDSFPLCPSFSLLSARTAWRQGQLSSSFTSGRKQTQRFKLSLCLSVLFFSFFGKRAHHPFFFLSSPFFCRCFSNKSLKRITKQASFPLFKEPMNARVPLGGHKWLAHVERIEKETRRKEKTRKERER